MVTATNHIPFKRGMSFEDLVEIWQGGLKEKWLKYYNSFYTLSFLKFALYLNKEGIKYISMIKTNLNVCIPWEYLFKKMF